MRAGTKVRTAASQLCLGWDQGWGLARNQEVLVSACELTLPTKLEPLGKTHPSSISVCICKMGTRTAPSVLEMMAILRERGCQDAGKCVILNFRSGLL